ncbi:MAG: hypothetical protein QOF00_3, partial [Pseudonocardiales bacterium]|nr:hypothetical protein [Pseudonocardiales bacterium]
RLKSGGGSQGRAWRRLGCIATSLRPIGGA